MLNNDRIYQEFQIPDIMSESSKYWLNGVYKCHNFAQRVENDNFPSRHIGHASGFHWRICIETRVINRATFAYPFIYHKDQPRTQISAYFKIINKDGSSSFKTESKHLYLKSREGCIDKYIKVEELLDEKNGYLDNGSLTVEYELQVDSVKGRDGIWRSNFFGQYFNWKNQNSIFHFIIQHDRPFFGHKQFVKLHSKKISDSNKDWIRVPESSFELRLCLQITHGARLPVTAGRFETTIELAVHFGFSNTVRYCDQQLIEMDESTKLEVYYFRFAVKHDLRCYLVHLLKQIETKKQLINFMSGMDLQRMSSESMKAIVAKIFSL